MIIRGERIAELLTTGKPPSDPFIICPMPNIAALKSDGAASVDLRLGTWLLTMRQARLTHIQVEEEQLPSDGLVASDRHPKHSWLAKEVYVPFGHEYVLHPRTFALAATLE